jgi:hypothetical protein
MLPDEQDRQGTSAVSVRGTAFEIGSPIVTARETGVADYIARHQERDEPLIELTYRLPPA